MTRATFDELPQAIRSQFKRKRFKSAETNGDGYYVVLDIHGIHRWRYYGRAGWKKERSRV